MIDVNSTPRTLPVRTAARSQMWRVGLGGSSPVATCTGTGGTGSQEGAEGAACSLAITAGLEMAIALRETRVA